VAPRHGGAAPPAAALGQVEPRHQMLQLPAHGIGQLARMLLVLDEKWYFLQYLLQCRLLASVSVSVISGC
jgi:hypothetical protein